MCCDSASVDLRASDLAGVVEDVDKCLAVAMDPTSDTTVSAEVRGRAGALQSRRRGAAGG